MPCFMLSEQWLCMTIYRNPVNCIWLHYKIITDLLLLDRAYPTREIWNDRNRHGSFKSFEWIKNTCMYPNNFSIILFSYFACIHKEKSMVCLWPGGVVNGKIETLRDGETSVFLCETETFPLFKLRNREFEISEHCKKMWDSETSNLLKKRDCETLDIRLKFCKTQIFWMTLRHPYLAIAK